MRDIIIASHNEGKVRELRASLEDLHFNIKTAAADKYTMPDETGVGFIENALLKARAISKASNLPALADDTGLVVHALNGAPGIYSARYAGEQATDQANIQKLLKAMEGITFRQAFFYCVIVLVRHALDPTPIIAEGEWHGTIVDEPRGVHGFGYDPIFYIEDKRCTAAELAPSFKQQLSHRAQAMTRLKARLHNFVESE